jgi:3-deoxy-7-phosphoheptulonate synthase
MHGNTVRTRSGRKTRLLSSIIREVREFQAIVDGTSGTAGGLHLETTPDLVAECAFGGPEAGSDIPEGPYRTLCDPRLNPEQSLVVTEKWYR